MKKWIASLAIFSLILVGTLVVYKEAFAITPFCWQCEDYCNYCGGNFSIEGCWWYGIWQYCNALCQNCTNPNCTYPPVDLCGFTICIMDPPI